MFTAFYLSLCEGNSPHHLLPQTLIIVLGVASSVGFTGGLPGVYPRIYPDSVRNAKLQGQMILSRGILRTLRLHICVLVTGDCIGTYLDDRMHG